MKTKSNPTPPVFLHLLLILAIACCCAGGSQAQVPPPASKEPRFRTLGLFAGVEGLCYMLKQKDVPVTVISDSRSAFYPKPPESPVVFYRIGKLADGTLTRTPVIEVDLSPGGQMPLLLFTRISESPEKLKVQVLNDDLHTFPGGSFRILNYEPSECGALIANKPTVIPAGGDKIIEPKPDEGQKAVFFQLYRLGKDDRKLVYSNNWAFSPGVRTLVVVTPAVPPSKQSMVRRITETVSTITESP